MNCNQIGGCSVDIKPGIKATKSIITFGFNKFVINALLRAEVFVSLPSGFNFDLWSLSIRTPCSCWIARNIRYIAPRIAIIPSAEGIEVIRNDRPNAAARPWAMSPIWTPATVAAPVLHPECIVCLNIRTVSGPGDKIAIAAIVINPA